ncbi:HigA family addiction module antitoxin [Nissabacter sp. SGAir0207]|uniref:HigA family addiction module antitoxin n=1 Tax=Nissabacter sp. SGAir0207 TaxID=2126321 RepID=UPI0010CD5DF5|nr:HigA family addiction module antitoxin [Nissabacter sp. SGAir0207]QCR38799.1 addiction module antidote protein, HigA family [Nissabacter sp. SGAir0207]
MSVQHPGEVIQAAVEASGLTLRQVGEKVGISHATLSRLINKKAQLTAEAAVKLGGFCNETPLALLSIQNRYDLAQIMGDDAQI